MDSVLPPDLQEKECEILKQIKLKFLEELDQIFYYYFNFYKCDRSKGKLVLMVFMLFALKVCNYCFYLCYFYFLTIIKELLFHVTKGRTFTTLLIHSNFLSNLF